MSISSGFWDHADSNTLVIPNQLCPPCKEFCSSSNLLRTLPQDYAKWEQQQKDGEPITLRPECQEFYQVHNYSNLHQCVAEGRCHLCAIFWSELNSRAGSKPLEELRRLEDDGVVLTGILKGGGKSFINYCLLTLDVGARRSDAEMQLLMSTEPRTAPIAQDIDAQLALSTESDATLSLARKWLHDCIAEHAACAGERQSAVWGKRLPTRVVSVSEDSSTQPPCVVNTDTLPSNTSYLTLSHSWGDGKFLKLLTTNLEHLYSSIPVDELSQTHKDALSITRRLGYGYIWIDSLCIIQDSVDDWKSQSAQMASIYGNSTCNIAAENASRHSGCFIRRNALMQRPCQLTHCNDMDPAEGVYAHPYHTGNWSAFPYHYYSSVPLLNRAWVQQERLLSPRILYFGGSEIHWECCSLEAAEAWPQGSPSGEHGFDEVYPLKAAFESLIKPFRHWDRDDWNGFNYELWHNGIFREYTAAELTFEKDRLVALAGMVDVIQKRTGMTYVAGLWKELLPMDLMWQKMDPPATGQRHLEPMPWKAPSWSWASVSGRKRFDLFAYQNLDEENVLYRSSVLDCVITQLETDQPILGEVSGGIITLTGILVPQVRPDTAETLKAYVKLDVDFPNSTELFYFCIMKTVNSETTSTHRGLLLAKADAKPEADGVEHTGTYIRVGVFVSTCQDEVGCKLDRAKEVTINIC